MNFFIDPGILNVEQCLCFMIQTELGFREFWNRAYQWTFYTGIGKWSPSNHSRWTPEFRAQMETFFKCWYLSRCGKQKSLLMHLPYEIWLLKKKKKKKMIFAVFVNCF